MTEIDFTNIEKIRVENYLTSFRNMKITLSSHCVGKLACVISKLEMLLLTNLLRKSYSNINIFPELIQQPRLLAARTLGGSIHRREPYYETFGTIS